jgi:hypothetical protein
MTCQDGYIEKSATITAAMNATGIFSSMAGGVGLSARSAADKYTETMVKYRLYEGTNRHGRKLATVTMRGL